MRLVSANHCPLCVDLDGTLIRSDLLVEAVFGLLKLNPFYALLLPVWLLKGKAYLKQQVADRVELDVTLLPYNLLLLEYLRAARATGRRLILTTASNIRYAEQVAFHLGIFEEVLASDAETNLSGQSKRDRLVAAFGQRGFDYAANGRVDLPIWAMSNAAILVDTPARVAEEARAVTAVAQIVKSPSPALKDWLRAIRLHQWLKNILVFLPLFVAHEWGNVISWLQSGTAFLAFGLCASSVYVLNDLLDLEADRKHPSKQRRAFAAGTIPIQHGLLAIPVLLCIAFAVALFLPAWFLAALGLYYVLTLAYSLRLKRVHPRGRSCPRRAVHHPNHRRRGGYRHRPLFLVTRLLNVAIPQPCPSQALLGASVPARRGQASRPWSRLPGNRSGDLDAFRRLQRVRGGTGARALHQQ